MEMDLTTRIIAIVVLILFSGYFSMAEISLAASPKVKLHQALDAGDKRAQKVLDLQVKPGPFFSVIQIGLNAIAILGGIIGETLFPRSLRSCSFISVLLSWLLPWDSSARSLRLR